MTFYRIDSQERLWFRAMLRIAPAARREILRGYLFRKRWPRLSFAVEFCQSMVLARYVR